MPVEAGDQTAYNPVTAELLETVLSRQLADLKPTLASHGYRLKDMPEQVDAKAAQIRSILSDRIEPKRTAEIGQRMLQIDMRRRRLHLR